MVPNTLPAISSPSESEDPTIPEVSSTKNFMQSETITKGPSSQKSFTTIIVSSVIIVILIPAIVAVIILIVLCHRKFGERIFPSKSRHQSDSTSSKQHIDEKEGKWYEDISGTNTYDVLHRSPKKKPAATLETQDGSNLSELYSVLDTSGNKNSKVGTSEGHYASDMYAVVDESTKKNLMGIYEAPDDPSASAVGDQKAKPKASETPDNPNLSEMYAVVDKTAKKEANRPHEDSRRSTNISEMYAVVDKTAKRNAKGSMESLNSPNIPEMYAMVDMKAKDDNSLHETSSSRDISDLYSVVDKSAKTKH